MTTRENIDLQCNQIRNYLSSGKYRSYTDIRRELGMNLHTFQRRMKKIYAEDIRTSPSSNSNSNSNPDIPPLNNQQNRICRILSVLECVSNLNYEIMMDKRNRAKDRILASENFLNIEFTRFNNAKIGFTPTDFLQYLQKGYKLELKKDWRESI